MRELDRVEMLSRSFELLNLTLTCTRFGFFFEPPKPNPERSFSKLQQWNSYGSCNVALRTLESASEAPPLGETQTPKPGYGNS